MESHIRLERALNTVLTATNTILTNTQALLTVSETGASSLCFRDDI
jgi:hypothetical protein